MEYSNVLLELDVIYWTKELELLLERSKKVHNKIGQAIRTTKLVLDRVTCSDGRANKGKQTYLLAYGNLN